MFDVEKERKTYESAYPVDIPSDTYFEALNEIEQLQAELNQANNDIYAGRKMWAEAQRARKERTLENDRLRAELQAKDAEIEKALKILSEIPDGLEIERNCKIILEQALKDAKGGDS